MHTDTLRLNHQNSLSTLPRRFFSGTLIFMAAYFVTISVNASAPSANPAKPDVIQLKENGPAVITGTVVSADDNFVIINSAGTEMKITLEKVDMKDEADTLFKPGMEVSVEGEMTGNDFGTPVVSAKTITARE